MKGIGFYQYRGELILLQDNKKWEITNYYDVEFNTLNDAKNHIDKNLGGWSGRCMPRRWLKDDRLKEYYKGRKYF